MLAITIEIIYEFIGLFSLEHFFRFIRVMNDEHFCAFLFLRNQTKKFTQIMNFAEEKRKREEEKTVYESK